MYIYTTLQEEKHISGSSLRDIRLTCPQLKAHVKYQCKPLLSLGDSRDVGLMGRIACEKPKSIQFKCLSLLMLKIYTLKKVALNSVCITKIGRKSWGTLWNNENELNHYYYQMSINKREVI